jgi:hypothetical protein
MTDAPRRIQRSRAKGWRMPEGAVYVGRPGVCGNPFQHPDRALSVRMFRVWLTGSLRTSALFCERMKVIEGKRMLTHRRQVVLRHALPALRGHDLACWCALDQPCHADVLLELANAPLRCEAVDG